MRSLKQVVSCLAVAIVALAASSAPVYADIVNGGFEMPWDNGGIPGWSASTSNMGEVIPAPALSEGLQAVQP